MINQDENEVDKADEITLTLTEEDVEVEQSAEDKRYPGEDHDNKD